MTKELDAEVICVAITIAKPGHEDRVRRALETLIAPVRVERGCIQYELHRDLTEPRRFVFVERWESRADFDAHCAAPHVIDYLAVVRDWIEWSEFYPLKLEC
jgi:quinol monooxygenase YgiN